MNCSNCNASKQNGQYCSGCGAKIESPADSGSLNQTKTTIWSRVPWWGWILSALVVVGLVIGFVGSSIAAQQAAQAKEHKKLVATATQTVAEAEALFAASESWLLDNPRKTLREDTDALTAGLKDAEKDAVLRIQLKNLQSSMKSMGTQEEADKRIADALAAEQAKAAAAAAAAQAAAEAAARKEAANAKLSLTGKGWIPHCQQNSTMTYCQLEFEVTNTSNIALDLGGHAVATINGMNYQSNKVFCRTSGASVDCAPLVQPGETYAVIAQFPNLPQGQTLSISHIFFSPSGGKADSKLDLNLNYNWN